MRSEQSCVHLQSYHVSERAAGLTITLKEPHVAGTCVVVGKDLMTLDEKEEVAALVNVQFAQPFTDADKAAWKYGLGRRFKVVQ